MQVERGLLDDSADMGFADRDRVGGAQALRRRVHRVEEHAHPQLRALAAAARAPQHHRLQDLAAAAAIIHASVR